MAKTIKMTYAAVKDYFREHGNLQNEVSYEIFDNGIRLDGTCHTDPIIFIRRVDRSYAFDIPHNAHEVYWIDIDFNDCMTFELNLFTLRNRLNRLEKKEV